MSAIVSIIIPTYNYGHLISETIDCLLAQTYEDWEAIIVDDGSTDNTENVVEKFLKNDQRISYVKQENSGVSASRNKGLEMAKGEFIQFLDADDLISPRKIELQINFFEKHDHADLCIVKSLFFDSSTKEKLYTDLELKNETETDVFSGLGLHVISDFVQRNLTVIESPLFRKSLLAKTGVFREDMRYLEDWDFWFRCAVNNFNFQFLNDDEAFVLVRSHALSATKQSNKIKVAEGKLRNLFNGYLSNSTLSNNEKKLLIKKNNKLLINTFRGIMAQTSYFDIANFSHYFSEMNSPVKFLKAFIKAINLKRKLFNKSSTYS